MLLFNDFASFKWITLYIYMFLWYLIQLHLSGSLIGVHECFLKVVYINISISISINSGVYQFPLGITKLKWNKIVNRAKANISPTNKNIQQSVWWFLSQLVLFPGFTATVSYYRTVVKLLIFFSQSKHIYSWTVIYLVGFRQFRQWKLG